jgi:hypothetical protein
LCKRIGAAAREKGHRPVGYQLLLVGFWFGGEIGSALMAGVLIALAFGEKAEEFFFVAYLAALLGAAVGAWAVFRIVSGLPDQSARGAEYDEFD